MKALKRMKRNLFLGLGGFVRLSYFDTAVADPGLQISGVGGWGVGVILTLRKEGAGLKKKFFRPSGLSLVQK